MTNHMLYFYSERLKVWVWPVSPIDPYFDAVLEEEFRQ